MTATLIISLIGCITGLTSFIYGTIRFLHERPNIYIQINERNCVCFQKCIETDYLTSYQAVAEIHVCNKSSQPVTIQFLDVYIDGELVPHYPIDQEEMIIPTPIMARPVGSKESDASPITYRVKIKSFQPIGPFRLEGFDVKGCFLYFPAFPTCKGMDITSVIEVSNSFQTKEYSLVFHNISYLESEVLSQ